MANAGKKVQMSRVLQILIRRIAINCGVVLKPSPLNMHVCWCKPLCTQVCGVTFHYYGINGGCNYNELDRRVSKGCVPQATCQGLEDSNVDTCVDREVESPACSSCCDTQYCNYFPLANPDYRKQLSYLPVGDTGITLIGGFIVIKVTGCLA